MRPNLAVADARKKLRTKGTNGRRVFVDGDGKSAWARRWRDFCASHAADLGGAEALSEAQESFVAQVRDVGIGAGADRRPPVDGERVDLGLYARVAGHLRRRLETLGVKRVAKDTTPSLSDIIAAHEKRALGKSSGKPVCPHSPIGVRLAVGGAEKLVDEFPDGETKAME